MSQQISAQEKFDQAKLLQTDMAFVLSVKEDVINARNGTGLLSNLSKVWSGVSNQTKTDLNDQLASSVITILDAQHAALEQDFNTLMK